MDQLLLKQLTRQIKILNFWISLFGSVIVIGLIVLGVLVYQAISFTRSVSTKLDTTQQSIRDNLNVKQQVCQNQSDNALLNRLNEICN